jgi:hypothetical protein
MKQTTSDQIKEETNENTNKDIPKNFDYFINSFLNTTKNMDQNLALKTFPRILKSTLTDPSKKKIYMMRSGTK